MKNTALITISTLSRSFSVPLGPATRMVLGGATLALIVFIVGAILAIYKFSGEVKDLSERKHALDAKILNLNAGMQEKILAFNSTLQDLQNEINTQRYAFERLNELEAEIPFLDASYTENAGSGNNSGWDNAEQPETEAKDRQELLLNRIKQVKLSLVERNWLLHSVPNGHPMPGAMRITSGFGKRLHPITGKRQYHYGVDIRAAHGEPVLTTADGVVKFAGTNQHGYGRIVVIAHNYGFITRYAHLDKILVKKGQYVSRGDMIGRAGNSGIATGTHLHYEIEYLDSKINPKPFMTWGVDNYTNIFTREKAIQWPTLINLVRMQVKQQGQQLLLPTAATLKAN